MNHIFEMLRISIEVSNQALVTHMQDYHFEKVYMDALDNFKKVGVEYLQTLTRYFISFITFC